MAVWTVFHSFDQPFGAKEQNDKKDVVRGLYVMLGDALVAAVFLLGN